MRSLSLRLGAFLVGLFLAMALLSFLYPVDPNAPDFLNRLKPPSPEHPLGTDPLGRDLLARLLHGAKNALLVGVIAVSVASTLGALLGLLAGYLGGLWDGALSLLMEALYALPGLLLALLFAALLGPGAVSSTLAVGLSMIPAFFRVARAGALSLKTAPFVEAALALGASPTRVLLRHLLPNLLGPLLVQASLAFAAALLAEAALSYLGLGTQPPEPSLGRMLREAQSFLPLSPYPALVPGLALSLAVLGFNLLGDGLRDLLDPRR
ncbi:peptide/nickel transport system permease protein [Thermus arciformis]|uniref:Peptide/nickel transport system permease protein n=1 Tax=Thermus arciformis TaxID=482827 RepID=A0A1G7KS47_9DEIN|nr:ABC transporter permease subunit [Thermus arciformis]SDF39916.1 peptide/nickel transport system permease protein [Thermus arciformis]